MVTTITGTTNKPVSSDRLKNYFSAHNEFDGILYMGTQLSVLLKVLILLMLCGFHPNRDLLCLTLSRGNV